MSKCNEDYIKEAAYFLWEQAGRPQGQDDKFWAMAVEQSSCSQSTAKKATSGCTKKACASSGAAAKKPAAKSASKVASKK